MRCFLVALYFILLIASPIAALAQSQLQKNLLADPYPLDNGDTFFLYREGPQLVGERWNWSSGNGVHQTSTIFSGGRTLESSHYAIAASSSGLWVVNDSTVWWLHSNGKYFLADLPERPAGCCEMSAGNVPPLAVVLNDGSLLLILSMSGRGSGQAFRASLEETGVPKIMWTQLAAIPAFGPGSVAVKLSSGRVLMTSGAYNPSRQTWLYDPQKDVWTPTGTVGIGPSRTALAALPDGRAFIAGGNEFVAAIGSNNERLGSAHGAELWDADSGVWTPLPPLPMSFKVTAHGSGGPSAIVLPNGSLIVGGGMHRSILMLRAQGKVFAPHWTVIGDTKELRVGGIVQSLGGNDLVVAGGWKLSSSGQCCLRQAGGERVSWVNNAEQRGKSVGLARNEAAVDYLDELTFAAGGWESFNRSYGPIQASAVAELIDHKGGRVNALPPLPYPLITGRAVWVDRERVLVKAFARSRSDALFRGIDARLLEADSSGFLALYHLGRNTWVHVNDPRLARTNLAGIRNDEAILVGPETSVWAVTLAKFGIRALPNTIFARSDGVSRVVSGGRMVVAGGKSQASVIEAIDLDCRKSACPARLFGHGPVGPSRRHEIFGFTQDNWRLSAQSQAAGESAVIRPDGRVVSLGMAPALPLTKSVVSGGTKHRWLIEESNSEGTRWSTLPFPQDMKDGGQLGRPACGEDHSVRQCKLMIGDHASIPGSIIFFLHSRWSSQQNSQMHDLWTFAEHNMQWDAVGRDMTAEQLRTSKVLLRRLDDKQLYGSYFHLHNVRLALE